MDIILIAGLWLKERIWDEVGEDLQRRGHQPTPVALPGVDDGSTTATLADQVAAVVAAVDAADHPIVVGHSAACGLAWMAADRRPDMIEKVVLIGGFPPANGETYADFFELEDGVMAFPGWEPFEGPDSDDLDETMRTAIVADSVPVPEGVSRGVVTLSDAQRYEVPVVMVCPEYTPDQARAWIEAGDVPELERTATVTMVDIDSGHWPMVTRPARLAEILDEVAIAD